MKELATLAYAMELNTDDLNGFADRVMELRNSDGQPDPSWQQTLEDCCLELIDPHTSWYYSDNLNRALLSKYSLVRWISYYLLDHEQQRIYSYLTVQKEHFLSYKKAIADILSHDLISPPQ